MRRLAAPFLLFLICVGYYWKLTLTSEFTFLNSPDLANLDLPRLQFQASQWRHLRLPLWDPHQWLGQPFLGAVTGAAYPANWVLGLFPFDQGKLSIRVVHWYLVLIHFHAALAAYLLCRDWKRTRTASILGAAVFSFGGFLGTTDWPQILNGAAWLPLVAMFFARAVRGRRPLYSGAMAGALLGVTWWSGHHEVPIYATTAFCAAWLYYALARPASRRPAAMAALTLALVSALQLLPALEYGPLAKRWAGTEAPIAWNEPIPYRVHQHFAWNPAAIPGIVTPRPPVHVDPFIGIVAAALLVAGAARAWRLAHVRALVCLGLAGLVIALANHTFVHGVLYSALPMFGKARVPARALVLFSFAVAPLAAFGLDALRHRSNRWTSGTAWTLGVTGLAGLAAAAAGWTGPFTMTALAAATGAILLATGARAWAVCLLVIVEISNVAGANPGSRIDPNRPAYLDALYRHNDVASYLRAQPQPLRADVADADIPYNFGDWHGIDTLGGFAASVTTNLLELEWHRPRVQDLLGVNYYVAKSPPRPDLERVAGSASGVSIYRNPNSLPRAWTVHRATGAADAAALRRRLDDPTFDPRAEALLLTAPPPLESCATADEVRYVPGANPGRVQVDVRMACRGLLIVSETDFPGWRLTVDGAPAPPVAPFGALRGVVVDAGQHRVEWRYRPTSAILGAVLAALGWCLVAWAAHRTSAPLDKIRRNV